MLCLGYGNIATIASGLIFYWPGLFFFFQVSAISRIYTKFIGLAKCWLIKVLTGTSLVQSGA